MEGGTRLSWGHTPFPSQARNPVFPGQERVERERAHQSDSPGGLYTTLWHLPKLFTTSHGLPLKQALVGPQACMSVSVA